MSDSSSAYSSSGFQRSKIISQHPTHRPLTHHPHRPTWLDHFSTLWCFTMYTPYIFWKFTTLLSTDPMQWPTYTAEWATWEDPTIWVLHSWTTSSKISFLPALLPTSLVGSSVSTLPFSPRCSSPCYRSQPAHTSPSLLSARFLFLLAISARFSIIIGHLCKVRPNFATCPAHEFSPHKFFLLGLHICSSSQVLGQFGWIPLFDTAFNLMCELCPNRSR